jgi:hypothetical protein
MRSLRGGKQADRNGQQTEAERTYPDGMSHDASLPHSSGANSTCYDVDSCAEIRQTIDTLAVQLTLHEGG